MKNGKGGKLTFYDEFFVSSLVKVGDNSFEKGSGKEKRCAGCTALNIADMQPAWFYLLFPASCYWGFWETFCPLNKFPD